MAVGAWGCFRVNPSSITTIGTPKLELARTFFIKIAVELVTNG